ncbi:LAFE_0G12882g1_1 [Lachancea fermentati]|uniref:Elongin-C n=1 Tax=Lachancea fermentati TaxID=4955 RepID=A0A1G4MI20_LACFM|nr:LAFE_0G12882g1_1 [Lachancea fermentati]
MSEVTLVSAENVEFPVTRETAMISPTLKAMLSESFEDSEKKRIELKEIEAPILKKVIEYLQYCQKYQDATDTDDVPEFEVPTDMSLELLLVADYLNI